MRLIKSFGARVSALFAAMAGVVPGMAMAQDAGEGVPTPWALGFQTPVSTIAQEIQGFHDLFLIPMMFLISIFVIVLLGYTLWRYRASKNPNPSRVTHNVPLEIAWTLIPALILVVLAFPSTSLLYKYQTVPEDTDFTLKAIGFQWAWRYEYPEIKDEDGEVFGFDAYLVREESELTKPEYRLLETDNYTVVPVGETIRLQVAARDVLHAFALPAIGAKKDAVPGRLNEMPIRFEKPGVYFGQCSEICGLGHAYMPIAFKAVPQDQFNAWVAASELDEPANDVVATIWGLEEADKTIDTAALAN